jgi:hypothetical protein
MNDKDKEVDDGYLHVAEWIVVTDYDKKRYPNGIKYHKLTSKGEFVEDKDK